MIITITELSKNKFEVTVKKNSITKHIVLLSDKIYEDLSNRKISKKKLINYSFKFLLERESNVSILPNFKLEIISKYFPEFESEIKKTIKRYVEK